MTWLNAVDTSYRDEFRDLFEANFGRVEARMREMEVRLEAKLQHFGTEMRLEMGRMETRLIRWMFVFWVTTWLAVAGTMLALQRLR